MTYLTAAVVVQFNDPGKSKLYSDLGFASEAALESFITSYIIPGVEGYAANISGGSYTDDTVPAKVKMAAFMAACNVLSYMRTNHMGPPVVPGPTGLNLQVPISQAFTPEIRAILESNRTPIVKSSTFQTDALDDRWS